MEEYCIGNSSEVLERFQFFRRQRINSEPIDDFVIALKKPANPTDFCQCMKESLIRNRLVTGIRNEPTTKKNLHRHLQKWTGHHESAATSNKTSQQTGWTHYHNPVELRVMFAVCDMRSAKRTAQPEERCIHVAKNRLFLPGSITPIPSSWPRKRNIVMPLSTVYGTIVWKTAYLPTSRLTSDLVSSNRTPSLQWISFRYPMRIAIAPDALQPVWECGMARRSNGGSPKPKDQPHRDQFFHMRRESATDTRNECYWAIGRCYYK